MLIFELLHAGEILEQIQLKDKEGASFQAIPIITSNSFDYDPARPAFFSYIEFNLFPIKRLEAGGYEVISQSNGNSPLQLPEQSEFFRQIRDNTQYIIHPDEILADNFTFLALSKLQKSKKSLERFSEEGRQLIAEMEKILVE